MQEEELVIFETQEPVMSRTQKVARQSLETFLGGSNHEEADSALLRGGF